MSVQLVSAVVRALHYNRPIVNLGFLLDCQSSASAGRFSITNYRLSIYVSLGF